MHEIQFLAESFVNGGQVIVENIIIDTVDELEGENRMSDIQWNRRVDEASMLFKRRCMVTHMQWSNRLQN
jgi:hypothetical protein